MSIYSIIRKALRQRLNIGAKSDEPAIKSMIEHYYFSFEITKVEASDFADELCDKFAEHLHAELMKDMQDSQERLQRILAQMENQLRIGNETAKENKPKHEVIPSLWEINNSHISDSIREIRVILNPGD